MERSFVRSWELRAHRIRSAGVIASSHQGRQAGLQGLLDEMVFNLGHCQGELTALRKEQARLGPVWKEISVGVGGTALAMVGCLGLLAAPITGPIALAGAVATIAGVPVAGIGGKRALDGRRHRQSLELQATDLEREVHQFEAAIARVKEAQALLSAPSSPT